MTIKDLMNTGLIGAYERVNIIDIDSNKPSFFVMDKATPICNLSNDMLSRDVYKIEADSEFVNGPFIALYISKKIEESNLKMIGGMD